MTAALDLHTSKQQKLIRASAMTEKALKEGVLFGLAQRVGEAIYGTHGMALRRSIKLPPDKRSPKTEEFKEPHRRGELLVAAVLGAFLKIWRERIELFGELESGMISRVGVVDGAIETADHLLTIVVRALDYCPPTDLLYGDFLSAMLTADYEIYPDDTRYGIVKRCGGASLHSGSRLVQKRLAERLNRVYGRELETCRSFTVGPTTSLCSTMQTRFFGSCGRTGTV